MSRGNVLAESGWAKGASLQVRALARRMQVLVFVLVPIVLGGCMGFTSTPGSPQNTPGSVQITTASVPSGQVGVTYSTSLVASGGTPAYTWSISAGSLPAGLTLSAISGVISGTPTASGSFTFTAKVTDSTSPTKQTAANSFTITIAAATANPPTVTLTAPANGATVSGTITLSATATASSGASIAWVQFQVNGANVGGQIAAAPYTLSFNTDTLANGSATIDAIAQDSAGKQGTSSTITVTVNNSTGSGSTQTIYVSGSEYSPTFPTTDGTSCSLAPSNGCPFLAILTRSGGSTTLTVSTVLNVGGGVRDMMVDAATGDAIFVGSAGPGLPTTAGAFQQTLPPDNKTSPFVCRFSSAGVKKFCTYFTTDNAFYENIFYGVAPTLDANGDITAVGGDFFCPNNTNSPSVCPTANPNGFTVNGVTGQIVEPSLNPPPTNYGIILKLKGDGSSVRWFTVTDPAFHNHHPSLDASGNIYNTFEGVWTAGTVPSNAYRTSSGAFGSTGVFKLSADGKTLLWATYTQGSSNLDANVQHSYDFAFSGVVLDSSNPPGVYFTARSGSTDTFCIGQTNQNPGCTGGATGYQKSAQWTPGALGGANAAFECAIEHVSGDGTTMLHSTFLSGSAGNLGNNNYPNWGIANYAIYGTVCDGIETMPDGNIVVQGVTTTTNLIATPGAYQTTNNSINEKGYLVIFDPTLSTLIAGTYVGGTGTHMQDSNGEFSFDSQGNLWNVFPTAGQETAEGMATNTNDFPTTADAYQSSYSPNCYDTGIYALNPTLTSLVYASYFGAPSALSSNNVCSATSSFPGVLGRVVKVITK